MAASNCLRVARRILCIPISRPAREHGLAGAIIFFTAMYFIMPPTDSEMNAEFFKNKWDFHNVTAAIQLPLRAFIPVPAWWEGHLWNTEILLEAKNKLTILKFINPFIVLTVLWISLIALRKAKDAQLLFIVNLIASIIVTVTVFPLTTERYAGFIFIGNS